MSNRDDRVRSSESELLKQLVSKDWRERKEAVEDLARLDRHSLARAALEIVRQDHVNLGALNGALQLLERVGQPLTADIIAMLNSSDRDLRIYVPIILAELGGEDVERALIQTAVDPDQSENVRFNAVEALGKLRSAGAAPVLAELLLADAVFLKYGVVVALGQIGLSESAPLLLPLLADPYLHEAAVTALGNTGDAQAAQAIGAWINSYPSGAPLAVMAVAAIERRQARTDPEAGQLVRQSFYDAVGLEGGRRLSLFAEPLKEDPEYPLEDPFWRDLASILGWAGDRWPTENAVRSALVRLLAFPDARSTAEAALRQCLVAAPGAVPPELRISVNSTNSEEAYAAARLLGYSADPDSLPALAEALRSTDETLAALAAESIGRINDPQAIQLLLAAMDDPRAYLRQAAADALAAANLPWFADHAEQMLLHTEPEKRVLALRLLAHLPGEKAARAAMNAMEDPDAAVRRAALELLPRSADPAVVQLFEQAIEDPDENLRRTAVHAAANLPTQAALPLLERAAHDRNHWVRVQAVRGLARNPGQQTVSWLAACMQDPFPPVRSAVVEALAQYWHSAELPERERERVRELLVLAQNDEELIVRQAALSALETNQ